MAMTLHAIEYGEGEPVAILHGLFGSGRNWASVAQRLAANWRVIAFDLRNHGASPWSDIMDYVAMADDVRAAMQARGHKRYSLIGHSMGGKAAMVAALIEPNAVESLVVVDIAPVTYPTMPYSAYVRAMRELDLAAIIRRRDADTAIASTVGDPTQRAFLLQNLVLGDGAPHWRINLAAIQAALPILAAFPALRPGAPFDGPALFIAGGKSHSLTIDQEPAVTAQFRNASIVRLADAGHWVHTDAPEAFLSLVESFLATRISSNAD